MKTLDKNEELFFSYLLGELSEEEEERIEARYLGDEEFLESLLMAEDELIDSYVQRQLPGPRQARFETHFMRSPGRRERVEFAEAWLGFVSRLYKARRAVGGAGDRPERKIRPFKSKYFLAPLAATVIIALAGSLLSLYVMRLSSDLKQARTDYSGLEAKQRELEHKLEEYSSRNEQLARQLEERPRPDPPSPGGGKEKPLQAVAFLALTTGGVRGQGGAKELTIRPGDTRARLQIHFDGGEYGSYQAVVKTVDGDEVLRQGGLKARQRRAGKSVAWILPAARLDEGDYTLTLSGVTESGAVEDLGRYAFRVTKR